MNPKCARIKTKLSHYCLSLCLCVLIGVPITAHAQQWQFEPVVKLTAEYDDNTQLTPDESSELDSTAFTVDANGRFVRRTQSSEVRISPRVRLKTYSESTFDDTNDVFLDFFAARNLERSNVGLQARFAQEDVRTAEIDDPDFDNPDINSPVNLDTGRIRIGTNRDSIIVSPYFSHRWTETVGFRIDADYVDVSYDQSPLNLRDYTNASLALGLSYRLSDRSTWSLGVFASDYEAEATNALSESLSTGARLEFRHNFSPTMEGRVSVGYQDVDSDVTSGGATVSESNGVTLFSAGITKAGEITRLVLDASQTVDPGGSGFVQERTQFRLRITRQLSPKMYGNFNARVMTTDELRGQVAGIERDFQRYGVGLEWRMTRKWSLRGDYTFTDQEFDQAVGNASSNEFSISFVYEPARIR